MAQGAQADLASQQTLSPPSALVCHPLLAPLVFHRFLGFQSALPSPELPGGQPGPWSPWSLLVQGIHALLCLPGLLLDQAARGVPGWLDAVKKLPIFRLKFVIRPALPSLPWTGGQVGRPRCQAPGQRLPPPPGRHHHQHHDHYCTCYPIPQIGAIHPQAKSCRRFSLKLPILLRLCLPNGSWLDRFL